MVPIRDDHDDRIILGDILGLLFPYGSVFLLTVNVLDYNEFDMDVF